MLIAMLLLAGTAFLLACSLNAEGDDKGVLGNNESHGIAIRLVSLSPEVDASAPALQNLTTMFKRSEDMTFGVELKNVSHEPITLVGIRYGDGYAEETKGKLNSSMLGPHWFDFEFADADGKPIHRTDREFYHGWNVADNSSTHVLAPGESLIEVLRPGKFMSPMDYELVPGKYQVRVRYHGPNDSFRDFLRTHSPDKPALNAWPYEVISNQLSFSIGESSNRTKSEDLVWGKPVQGLQAASNIACQKRQLVTRWLARSACRFTDWYRVSSAQYQSPADHLCQ